VGKWGAAFSEQQSAEQKRARETMLLFQTVTHPQPPLKRGVCAIALWGEGFEWDFSTALASLAPVEMTGEINVTM
jgi:hypothetical protein